MNEEKQEKLVKRLILEGACISRSQARRVVMTTKGDEEKIQRVIDKRKK